MAILNAFACGLCCGATIHCFVGGNVWVGILNLVLCLVNGAIAVHKYVNG